MMKKLILGLLAALSFQYLSAAVVEIKTMQEVPQYLEGVDLVLFNISDTLYIPANTLASNLWRQYFAAQVKQKIADPIVAEALINCVKNKIVGAIPKKVTEQAAVDLIAQLQKDHQTVLGITKKCYVTPYAANFGPITAGHLSQLGIDFTKTLTYVNLQPKSAATEGSGADYTFDFGILFTNKRPEGEALLSFLRRFNALPQKIAMIDNSRSALTNVDQALAQQKIGFIGLRYGRYDELASDFDPDLGTIQFLAWMESGQLLSDEEARQLKRNDPQNYSLLLEQFIIR